MDKKYYFLLLISFSITPIVTFGFSIKTNPARTSSIIKSIEVEAAFHNFKSYNEKKLLNNLDLLNKTTVYLEQAQLNQFILTELYKLTLDSQFSSKKTEIEISNALITSTQKKLDKNSSKLSPFAKYIINQFIKDFSPYIKNNVIKKFYLGEIKNQKLNKKISNLIKYSSGWLSLFDYLSPKRFNNVVSNFYLKFVENISFKSALFGRNAPNQQAKYPPIYLIKLEQKDESKSGSSEDKNAEDIIKNLNVDESESKSKKIDEIINNI